MLVLSASALPRQRVPPPKRGQLVNTRLSMMRRPDGGLTGQGGDGWLVLPLSRPGGISSRRKIKERRSPSTGWPGRDGGVSAWLAQVCQEHTPNLDHGSRGGRRALPCAGAHVLAEALRGQHTTGHGTTDGSADGAAGNGHPQPGWRGLSILGRGGGAQPPPEEETVRGLRLRRAGRRGRLGRRRRGGGEVRFAERKGLLASDGLLHPGAHQIRRRADGRSRGVHPLLVGSPGRLDRLVPLR
mmetsp:Transcript_14117/g.46262  ORF Transcript_14117/g.46262 Transcript_14117/m.46262 type:complete len:242 (-) Transcript_14117:549-1274(-)